MEGAAPRLREVETEKVEKRVTLHQRGRIDGQELCRRSQCRRNVSVDGWRSLCELVQQAVRALWRSGLYAHRATCKGTKPVRGESLRDRRLVVEPLFSKILKNEEPV